MNGGAHATIGAAVGLAVALKMDSAIEESLILTGAGMLSGLVPDLDTGGKLSNRISVSNKYLNALVRLIGVLLAFYAYFYADSAIQIACYTGSFILLFILPKFSRSFMLMMTGVIIGIGGYMMMTIWLMLFGIYIIAAAFMPHRSYTHSLLGVLFYAVIAHYLSIEVGIQGLYAACLFGYISHLAADTRLIPGNKRGIKPLLPYRGLEL